MGLLGNYDSDDEGGGSGSDAEEGPQPAPAPVEENAPKKRKVDISRLPISRPLALGASDAGDDEEAPLKKAAELERLRPSNGRSLLDSLPAPKATLGAAGGHTMEGSGGGGGARIDLSGIGRAKKKVAPAEPDVASLLRSDVLLPDEIPEAALNHHLFGGSGKGPKMEVGPDGPSADDLAAMKEQKSFTSISADDMKDPNWYMNSLASAGGPGTHKGKTVPIEMSQYDADKWQQTTHANPNRTQKRKHQINWLAQEAMDKEAEMQDRNSSGRLTKAQTQMKYGW